MAPQLCGIYTVDTRRIERSVHRNLTNRGFWREPTDTAYRPEAVMTFDQLMKLTSVWNKDGKRDTSIKELVVLDVLDQTASAKIVAMWGIDYMHLCQVRRPLADHQHPVAGSSTQGASTRATLAAT